MQTNRHYGKFTKRISVDEGHKFYHLDGWTDRSCLVSSPDKHPEGMEDLADDRTIGLVEDSHIRVS